MLVRLVDVKGKVFWVNPLHVKVLQEGKKDTTELALSFGGQWGTSATIRVDRPIDEVAGLLISAMPEPPPGAYAALDDDQAIDPTGGAAAFMGGAS